MPIKLESDIDEVISDFMNTKHKSNYGYRLKHCSIYNIEPSKPGKEAHKAHKGSSRATEKKVNFLKSI